MDAAGAASQPPRAHLPRSRGWLVLASSDSEHERSLPNASTVRSGDINKVSAVMQEVVVGKLRAIGDAAGSPPDEVQVEFGIVLNAEAGAILASASAGANYKVTMTWKRSPG